MGSCHRSQRRICPEKGENISVVKNKEGEGSGVYKGSVEEEVYLIIEITTNITSVFCAEEE